MPVALIHPDLCQPEQCERGRCIARRECPTKAIIQLDPGEAPQVDSALCRGCSDCLSVCPARAITLE